MQLLCYQCRIYFSTDTRENYEEGLDTILEHLSQVSQGQHSRPKAVWQSSLEFTLAMLEFTRGIGGRIASHSISKLWKIDFKKHSSSMFKSVFVQKLNLSTCLTKLRLTASHKMFKISGPVKRSKTLASTSVKLQCVSMSQSQTALKLHTIKLSNLKWTWRFRLYVPSNCHKMLERLGILRNTVNHDYGDLRSPRSRSLPATAMVVIRCASCYKQPWATQKQPSQSFTFSITSGEGITPQ